MLSQRTRRRRRPVDWCWPRCLNPPTSRTFARGWPRRGPTRETRTAARPSAVHVVVSFAGRKSMCYQGGVVRAGSRARAAAVRGTREGASMESDPRHDRPGGGLSLAGSTRRARGRKGSDPPTRGLGTPLGQNYPGTGQYRRRSARAASCGCLVVADRVWQWPDRHVSVAPTRPWHRAPVKLSSYVAGAHGTSRGVSAGLCERGTNPCYSHA